LTGAAFKQQMEDVVPESVTFPSTFNHKPSGTSGVLELVNKVGLQGREWVMPYRKLLTIHGVLVIIAPSESLEDFEIEQILDWVGRGNHLVYLDDFSFKSGHTLLDKLKMSATEGKAMNESVMPVKSSDAPEFAHVNHLTLSADSRLFGAPPLISDRNGTLLADVEYGKGKVLIGTVPTLVSNRRLSDQKNWSNFQYFVNRLTSFSKVNPSEREVWFDERCHGYSNNGNVFFFLLRGPFGLVMLQLLFAMALGIAAASQRFGQLTVLNTKRKISNLEFIYGLANTYSRAKANTASLEIIGQVLRTNICKALMISPHDTNEQLLEALQSTMRLSSSLKDEMTKYLKDYQTALTKANLSDNEFKELIIRCDKISDQLTKTLNATLYTSNKTTRMTDGKNS
jgi:hypothetical protein